MGEIGNLFNTIFTYPIFNGLVLLYQLFGDFALAIIVLTVVIKLVLFPLTLKQLKSMKATQALQPQMAEIRKKYAKDQQAQAMALQALYKEYGVNPLAGCLPMLVQLPVLYGLFYALNTLVGTLNSKGSTVAHLNTLNHILYSFVPQFTKIPNLDLKWFTFLSPALNIPLAQPHNIFLPVLAGAATFIQLRMSQPQAAAAKNKAPANDPTAQSMKIMQYFMPVFIVYIGWTYPAGLALYWTVSSIFQAVQQYFVTGWGSLLTTPTFKKELPQTHQVTEKQAEKSRTYTGDRQRQRTIEEQANVPEEAPVENNENHDGNDNQLRTATRGSGSSQYNRRRQRGSSASARRRAGGVQRSRS